MKIKDGQFVYDKKFGHIGIVIEKIDNINFLVAWFMRTGVHKNYCTDSYVRYCTKQFHDELK